MNANELDTLRNENQLLKLRVSALEDQIDALKRQRPAATFLEDLGLADEQYFVRRLHEAVLSASRYARFLCVVQADANQIKSSGPKDSNYALETAARLREELRSTDLVAYFESGRVMVLLEEADVSQAIQALKRVSREMAAGPLPSYALACFPIDTNRDEALLEIVENRVVDLRSRAGGSPAVHAGEEVLSLSN